MEHLSEEEKLKVMLQVDHFVEIIEERSGLTFAEVVEVIKWSRNHKSFFDKLSTYSALTVIGILISALLYAVWKGIVNSIHIDAP